RSKRDWSSDVCSSDLVCKQCVLFLVAAVNRRPLSHRRRGGQVQEGGLTVCWRIRSVPGRGASVRGCCSGGCAWRRGPIPDPGARSEERRVGGGGWGWG